MKVTLALVPRAHVPGEHFTVGVSLAAHPDLEFMRLEGQHVASAHGHDVVEVGAFDPVPRAGVAFQLVNDPIPTGRDLGETLEAGGLGQFD